MSTAPTPDAFDRAAAAFDAGEIGACEALCREILGRDPLHVDAICLLADVAQRYGRSQEALALLQRAVQLAPNFPPVRLKLAHVLHDRLALEEALAQLCELERMDADGGWALSRHILRGAVLTRMGRNDEAIAAYATAHALAPQNIEVLKSLGHAHKTLGDLPASVSSYRRVTEIAPAHGDAWWSLANLKTVRFTPQDIETMQRHALSETISRDDFIHISFALGKAYEDAGSPAEAFAWYQRGNAVRRRLVRYSAARNHDDTQALMTFFTAERYEALQGGGASDPAPIFIVGLPRSGSTLIEQILASHSEVDGTQELPDLMSIAMRISGRKQWDDPSHYPAALADMSAADFRALGEEYLERTRIHRGGAPRFIDKLPNNFAHVGLLRLVLPNARIIDARRNPMDCCFSCYKQLFAKGQNFTYSLKELGQYYRDYLDLMEYWDRTTPGAVLRVLNDDMIADPEVQIRRLLDFCGLPHEQACFEFHKNDRPVRTPSAEQVRKPVNAEGLGRWRAYEAELQPLKDALADALDRWNAPQ